MIVSRSVTVLHVYGTMDAGRSPAARLADSSLFAVVGLVRWRPVRVPSLPRRSSATRGVPQQGGSRVAPQKSPYASQAARFGSRARSGDLRGCDDVRLASLSARGFGARQDRESMVRRVRSSPSCAQFSVLTAEESWANGDGSSSRGVESIVDVASLLRGVASHSPMTLALARRDKQPQATTGGRP